MSALVRYISAGLLAVLSVSVFLFSISYVYAQPSYTMNYQGKLTNNSGLAVTDGTYEIEFKLYTQDSGGVAIWTETRSGVNEVTVTNGLFSVMLGSVTSLSGVNFNQPLYLGVKVEADAEMTPRKALGTVPSAFEARHLGGVASTSFLRSDVADSASGLLTFAGGLISNSSSTIANLTTLTATTTNLVINGERFTDFTGVGLTNIGGVLTVATSSLGLASAFSNSAGLAALLSDETGTGNVVFSASPTLTGTLDAVSGDFSSTLTMSGSAANIALGSNFLSGDGGDEGIFIDGSGNVGIGTSTPTAQLHVEGDVNGPVIVRSLNRSQGTSAFAQISASTPDSSLHLYALGQNYTTDGRYVGGTGILETSGIQGLGLSSIRSDINFWTDGNNNRMTIGRYGNVGIGTTTPGALFDVQGAAQFGTTNVNLITAAGKITGLSSTYFGTDTSANLATILTDELGTGNVVYSSALSGYSTAFTTSAGLAALLSDETGTGNVVFSDSPTFTGTTNFNIASVGTAVTPSVTAATGDIVAGGLGGTFQFDENLGSVHLRRSSPTIGHAFLTRYERSRGTTAVPTAISAGDDISSISGYAYDGAGFIESSRITLDTAGTVSTGVVPGFIRFYTANTAGIVTERLTINENGTVQTTNAGAGTSLLVDQNGAGIGLSVDKDVTNTSDATNGATVVSTSVVNDAGTYTKSGTLLSLTNNVSETSGIITDTSVTLSVANTHADATGNTVFVNSDGIGAIALNIDAENTTADAVNIDTTATTAFGLDVLASSLTTGSIARFYSNGTDTSVRSLVDIVNDNVAATGAVALRVQQDSTADIVNFFDGTTEVFTILDGGNVGIGDSTPSALFTVGNGDLFQVNSSGAVVAATGITSSGAITFSGLTAGGVVQAAAGTGLLSVGTLGVSSGGTGTGTTFTQGSVPFAGVSGVYTQDNANFFWNDTNNRLGIGTASPQTSLQVGPGGSGALTTHDGGGSNFTPQFANIQNSGVSGIGIGVSDGTNNRRAAFFVDQTNAVWGLSSSHSTGAIPFNIRIGSADYFRIDGQSGNTGIGTTTPSERLDVNGSIRFGYTNETTGVNAFRSGRLGRYLSGAAPFAEYSFIQPGTADAFVIWNANSSIVAAFGQDGDSTNTNAYFSGNVGIGTTTPTLKLDILGGSGTNQLRIADVSTDATNKLGRLVGRHFTNAEEDILGLTIEGRTSLNLVSIGGNSPATGNAATSIAFYTAANNTTLGGTTRMLIDSAGNVGIGDNGPDDLLNIHSATAQSALAITSLGADTDALIKFELTDGTAAFTMGVDDSDGDKFKISGAALGTNDRLTIDSSGNVGIGTTTPLQKLQVFGNIRVGTTGSNGCIEDYGGGVIGGTCSSDERLKQDIEALASSTERSYLEALTSLTPVTYTWNQDAAERYGKSMNVANLGLIAQDVEDVFPELVSRNNDNFRQVDFRALPFYIIEAVKELWTKVQGIDERVEDLEAENEYLKSRLDEIEDELNVTPPPSPTPDPEPTPEPEPTPDPEPSEEPPAEPPLTS